MSGIKVSPHEGAPEKDNLGFMLSKIEVKADHPITCLNPDVWFSVYEYQQEYRDYLGACVITVRGENTCWFRLDQSEVRMKS